MLFQFDNPPPFADGPRALMKLLLSLALLSTCAYSAGAAEDGSADHVAPTKLIGRGGKPQRLISSELNARELHFIISALDVRGTLVFLARKTAEARNATLRKLGDEIQKTLPAQTAVLTTLAEMRKVSIPEESARQQNLEKKLATLKGARFEKALLDALIDANQDLVNACEAGLRSTDKSVQQFAEQTLPYAQGTLARVQAMAGIAPRRAPETAVTPKNSSRAQGAKKPGFRANVPAVGSGED